MYDSYADIFAARAKDYHRAMAERPVAREAEFAAAMAPLEGRSGTLIDAPSGGGYLAAHCTPAWRYIGIEPVDDFFDAGNASLWRVRADLSSIPIADGSADAIVSLAGLHHEPDLAPVFEEFRRLLRPGGLAVIADVEADSGPARFLNGFVAANNPQGHDGRFFDDRTRERLEKAGLTVISDELVSIPWAFSSENEAGSFCGQLFHLPKVHPAAVADALNHDVGFDTRPDGIQLRWSLRRLVCTH